MIWPGSPDGGASPPADSFSGKAGRFTGRPSRPTWALVAVTEADTHWKKAFNASGVAFCTISTFGVKARSVLASTSMPQPSATRLQE